MSALKITRPNGTVYRPRKVRAIPLCQDEDSPIDEIVVLGTHDIRSALAYARALMDDDARRRREGWDDCAPYVLVLDEASGTRGFWSRRFWGFYEGGPQYSYRRDDERGAAGVAFVVREVDIEAPQLGAPEGLEPLFGEDGR